MNISNTITTITVIGFFCMEMASAAEIAGVRHFLREAGKRDLLISKECKSDTQVFLSNNEDDITDLFEACEPNVSLGGGIDIDHTNCPDAVKVFKEACKEAGGKSVTVDFEGTCQLKEFFIPIPIKLNGRKVQVCVAASCDDEELENITTDEANDLISEYEDLIIDNVADSEGIDMGDIECDITSVNTEVDISADEIDIGACEERTCTDAGGSASCCDGWTCDWRTKDSETGIMQCNQSEAGYKKSLLKRKCTGRGGARCKSGNGRRLISRHRYLRGGLKENSPHVIHVTTSAEE